MFCMNCGQELPDKAVFCFMCGTKQELTDLKQTISTPHLQKSPLVPAKCTNCGGVLDIDPDKDSAICPFCNSAFVVQQAIQNYNLTINSGVINIANANIQSGPSIDNLLIRAEEFIPKHDFVNARAYFEQVLDYDVDNKRARLGVSILDNYIYSVYRVCSVSVGGEQLLGRQYLLLAYFTQYVIEHISKNTVCDTTVIPYEDIINVVKRPAPNNSCSVVFETKSGNDVRLNILSDNDRNSVVAADEIIDYYNHTALPTEIPDVEKLKQEALAETREYYRTRKRSLFSNWLEEIYSVTYKYMKKARVPFTQACAVVRSIATPK